MGRANSDGLGKHMQDAAAGRYMHLIRVIRWYWSVCICVERCIGMRCTCLSLRTCTNIEYKHFHAGGSLSGPWRSNTCGGEKGSSWNFGIIGKEISVDTQHTPGPPWGYRIWDRKDL
jgi:hypothetical protein